MKALRRLFRRLTAATTVRRDEARLRQEIEDHLALQTRENICAGMSPQEARRQAVLKFGAIEMVKEAYRDQRTLPSIDNVLQDVRYAARGLRKNPGFALVVVATLALGIGATTALFTITDQVLLRLLPVKNPRELALVSSRGSYYGDNWGDGTGMSYPMYTELRDRNDVFNGMFARFSWELQARVQGRADRVLAEYVSGTYFPVLGVNAALGRTILPGDDAASQPDVAVLSHRYWQTSLGADPNVVGTSLVANNRALTVIGVAEEGFEGTNLGIATQVFVPIRLIADLTPLGARRERPILDDSRTRWAFVFGRLRADVTLEEAQARLQPLYVDRVAAEIQEEGFARASDAEKKRYLQSTLVLSPGGDGQSTLRRQLTRPLWILMAIVVAVLLIACANLANLLLARAVARQREFATRLALGATRRRLARQLLTEAMLLAIVGAAVGLVIATWGARALLTYVPNPGTTLTIATTPDWRILTFTIVVAIFTGTVFGTAPALRSTHPELATTLKTASGTLAGSDGRLRRGFMVAQVTLSVLLLVGAGLFVRSLSNLMHTNLGVNSTHTLSFAFDPDANGYTGERGKAFAKELRQRLLNTPGVSQAAFVSQPLLTGGAWSNYITIEGVPFDPERRWYSFNNAVSPGFFSTMGIAILQGRDFEARDERIPPQGTPLGSLARVAIANRTFVERYLGGRSPIGVRVGFGLDAGTPTAIELVGVVADAKYSNVRAEIPPQLYFPMLEGPRVGRTTMYVRTSGDPDQFAGTVQQVVRQFDPAIPIFDIRTFEDQIARSLSTNRLIANLAAVFSGLATLLAMIGLYGVLVYTVTQRTREIGVRIAMGAITHNISWLVLREVCVVVGLGVGLALPAIWGLTRLVKGQLYDVTPMDPLSIAGAIGLLSLVAMTAAFLPARRAASINPVVALRYE